MKKIFLVFGLFYSLFLLGCECEEGSSKDCIKRTESTEFAEYDIDVCLTGFAPVDGEIKQLISELSEDVVFAGKELKSLGSAGKGGLYISQKNFSSVDDVKSVLLTASINTGGAHPNTHYYTWTYRESEKEMLKFSSLFQTEHNPMWTIAPIAKTSLLEKLGDAADESMIDAGINVDNVDNYRSFVLDGEKLVLLFEPYQVAPYATGSQKVEIPLDDLQVVLAPPFLKINGQDTESVDHSGSCESAGGKWLTEYRECEMISREWCEQEMGIFHECESACRHDSSAEMCTMQCVLVCEF